MTSLTSQQGKYLAVTHLGFKCIKNDQTPPPPHQLKNNVDMKICDICDKTFKRRDNMLRHKRNVHSQKEGSDSDDSMDIEQKPVTDESDSKQHVSNYDPWDSLIQKAFEQCRQEFEQMVTKLSGQTSLNKALDRAYEEPRSSYGKALANNLCQQMMWFITIQKDPVYKRMHKTVKDVMMTDDYSKEEAWKYAISKRKLLDSILEDFDPPSVDADNDTD